MADASPRSMTKRIICATDFSPATAQTAELVGRGFPEVHVPAPAETVRI